jgi:hypothetical protein
MLVALVVVLLTTSRGKHTLKGYVFLAGPPMFSPTVPNGPCAGLGRWRAFREGTTVVVRDGTTGEQLAIGHLSQGVVAPGYYVDNGLGQQKLYVPRGDCQFQFRVSVGDAPSYIFEYAGCRDQRGKEDLPGWEYNTGEISDSIFFEEICPL